MDVLVEVVTEDILKAINSYQPIDYYISYLDHTFGEKWVFNDRITYRKGKTHSFNDRCVYDDSGPICRWYKNGALHRDNGPAEVDPYTHYWFQNGMLHRVDGPAIYSTTNENYYEWYLNDELHRIGGPAIIREDDIIMDEGIEAWYQYGKRHRDDGPALIWANDDEEWYKNGELYRNG